MAATTEDYKFHPGSINGTMSYQELGAVYFYTMQTDDNGNKFWINSQAAGTGKTRSLAAAVALYAAEMRLYDLGLTDKVPTYKYIWVVSTSPDHRDNNIAEFQLVLGNDLMPYVSFKGREDALPNGRTLLIMDESQSFINNKGEIPSSIVEIENRNDLSIIIASATPWTNSLKKGDSIKDIFGGTFDSPHIMVTFLPPLTTTKMVHWTGFVSTGELQQQTPLDMSKIQTSTDISLLGAQIAGEHLRLYKEVSRGPNIASMQSSAASMSLAMAVNVPKSREDKDELYSLTDPYINQLIEQMGPWAAMPYISHILALAVKVHLTRPGKFLMGVFLVKVLLKDYEILLTAYGYRNMKVGPNEYIPDRDGWYFLVVNDINDINFLATLPSDVKVMMISPGRFMQSYSYPQTLTLMKNFLRYNDAANSQANARIVRLGSVPDQDVVVIDPGTYWYEEDGTVMAGHEYAVLKEYVLDKRREIGQEVEEVRNLNIFRDVMPPTIETPLDPYLTDAPAGPRFDNMLDGGDFFAETRDYIASIEIWWSQLLSMMPLAENDYPQRQFVMQKQNYYNIQQDNDPRYSTYSGSVESSALEQANVEVDLFSSSAPRTSSNMLLKLFSQRSR